MGNSYMLLSEHRGILNNSNLRAEVLRKIGDECSEHVPAGTFGIKMYIDEMLLGIEWYEGKSESWADDAAENYVLGIKMIFLDLPLLRVLMLKIF